MERQAVVIGGSLAGLLAARVLADHFSRVTIVERDILPEIPQARRGLPQARHVHVLLWRGQQILEGLFPGLQAALQQAGAPCLDWIGEARWFNYGGWAPIFHSQYIAHPCSRDLLEWCVRTRLSQFPQVQFVTESEVVDLLANPEKTRITGVWLRQRGQQGGDRQALPADLVVDASGRDSRVPHWLDNLGYALVEDTVVNSFLGYATRLYQPPPGEQTWKSLLVRGVPPANKRGGVINPIEGGRWMVTLAGGGRDYPPTDEAGYLAFARSLPVPDLANAIQAARPLGSITGYRKTENRWHHYERLARWPDRLVVIGDAFCAFNPVYGQGMTTAALQALALDRALRDTPGGELTLGWAKSVQARLGRAIAGPWLMSTGDDYRYPETEGPGRNPLTRLTHNYMDRVIRLANQDPAVFLTFFEVFQLTRPISAFFHPSLVMKVLRSPSPI